MRTRRAPDRTLVHRCPEELAEAHEATWSRTASPPHAHGHWQVAMGLAGRGRVLQGGAERIVSPGEPFVVPPGQAHAIAPAGGSAWRFVSVYVPAAASGAAPRARPRGSPPGDPRALAGALLAAVQALRSGGGRRGGPLEALRALLPDPAPAPGPDDPRVTAAEAYLLARPDRPVSVEELARALGLAPRSMARRFREARGLSPYAFHLQLRIRRAQELLDRGLRLAEAAAATGFTDQSHFARHFTRLHGLPPGRWSSAGRIVQDRRRGGG